MSFKNWPELNENNGFSYAMSPEMAQQQLRMSIRLVVLMACATAIAVLAATRAPTPASAPPVEARRHEMPVMTFVADNHAQGSAAVHVR